MFTIKYTDQDGLERITQGKDIRAAISGKQALAVGWVGECPGEISFPTTVYVMNEAGATVAKYVVVADPK